MLYDAHGKPIPPGPLPLAIRHHAPRVGYFAVGRGGHEIAYGVTHSTEGTDDSVGWLTGGAPDPTSVHVIIQRDGSRDNIVNYQDTAYHVGWCKLPYHGYNTLGMEIANATRHAPARSEPYPDGQVWVAAHCMATWAFSYGFPLTHIVKHTEIAVWPPDEAAAHKPGDLRRYDPDGLDWAEYLRRVQVWLDFFHELPPSWQPYYII